MKYIYIVYKPYITNYGDNYPAELYIKEADTEEELINGIVNIVGSSLPDRYDSDYEVTIIQDGEILIKEVNPLYNHPREATELLQKIKTKAQANLQKLRKEALEREKDKREKDRQRSIKLLEDQLRQLKG